MKPENGLVIRYSFLWLREFERGEEAGRKARPVCVQLLMTPSSGMQEPVVLFLITSQPPTGSDDAMLLPALEARRVGLRTPAWLIVNHLNFEANFQASPWIEDVKPMGTFSSAFREAIRAAARKALRAQRMSAVRRDDLTPKR